MAEIVDSQPDQAYRAYGLDGVNRVLLYGDDAEHILVRLASQIAYRRICDTIVTANPPGESDILPFYALAGARDHSKARYNQECRVTGTSPAKSSRLVAEAAAAPAGAAVPQAGAGITVQPKGTWPKGTRKRGKFAEAGADTAAASPSSK